MQATKKTDISEIWVDLEQDTTAVRHSICLNHERHIHDIFWWKEQLYLETYALGLDVWAGLIQVRNGMNCQEGTVPDNTILWPTALQVKFYSAPRPGTRT